MTRIYQNPMEMIREVERDLFELGIGQEYQSATVQDQDVSQDPGYKTIEISYHYILEGFQGIEEVVSYLGNNLEWARTEFDERFFPNDYDPNPGQAWLKDTEKWKPFLRDGLFAYSYAERMQNQIPYVIKELTLRPYSRQAIISIYDSHQDMMNWGGRDRVPCSLFYHFLFRNSKLNLYYSQRSCDFLKFFSTDVFMAVRLLEEMCNILNVKIGKLDHTINSLHAFRKDMEERRIF